MQREREIFNEEENDEKDAESDIHSKKLYAPKKRRKRKMQKVVSSDKEIREKEAENDIPERRGEEEGIAISLEEEEEENSSYLVACVTQFGRRAAIDDNSKARLAVNTSRDWHYVTGLGKDTKINCRHYFKTCMKKLSVLAMEHKEVEKNIIPAGLGCRGRLDKEWQEYYLPKIQALMVRLQPFGIQTVLVRLPE